MTPTSTLVRKTLDGTLDLRTEADPRAASGRLLGVGCLAAMVFGAVAGSLNGNLQIVSSAVKMPLVLLLPLVVSLPALHWLHGWNGTPIRWVDLVEEGTLAVTRVGLSLLMGVPVIWLAWRLAPHHTIAVQVVVALVAAAFALSMRGLFRFQGGRSQVSRFLAVGLLAATLGQTSWILRPFVGDPADSFRWFEAPTGDFVRGTVDPMYLREAP